jgi:multicomponent Na+:H+ antiporter subunit E
MQLLIVLKRFLALALAWLALTGADSGAWLVGMLAAAASTGLSLHLLPPRQGLRLWAVCRMAPGFLWRSVLGGTDVAWRALHPRLPLRPGWRLLHTALPAGGQRVTLGGEISLLPGTLVAGTRGDDLLVHCLDLDLALDDDFLDAEREIAACNGAVPATQRAAGSGP